MQDIKFCDLGKFKQNVANNVFLIVKRTIFSRVGVLIFQPMLFLVSNKIPFIFYFTDLCKKKVEFLIASAWRVFRLWMKETTFTSGGN